MRDASSTGVVRIWQGASTRPHHKSAMKLGGRFLCKWTPLLVLGIMVYTILINTYKTVTGAQSKLNSERSLRPFATTDVIPACTRQVDMDTVHVIIMGDEKTFIGLLTLANSIIQNTKSDVMFHFVTYPSDATRLRDWINESLLKNISYEIIEFPREKLNGKYLVRSPRKDLASPLNFARVFLTDLLPCVGRVIFIDADCLVLGDISDLYHVQLAEGHVTAGLRMCDFYDDPKDWPLGGRVLNYSNAHVRNAAISKDACMMNGGVFVADLMRWEEQYISQQLQYWMELNTREPVFKYGDNGSGTQAVLVAVLHNKYTPIPKEWNTISLAHRRTRAKLVHWNGSGKPWLYPGTYYAEWMQYYVPDPQGLFRPRNVWKEKRN